jgi:putative tryptophan/tyrosine transport system substrate-binding protein
MNRRSLLRALGAGVTASHALGVRAQPASRKPRVGILLYAANDTFRQGFTQALRETGYVEGQNLEIVYRDGEGRDELLDRRAVELVRAEVEVIVVWSTSAAEAAKRATQRIPIVASVADPLGSGLVKSLARPEANLTGVSSLAFEISAKRVDLLCEALPGVRSMAFLGLRDEPNLPLFLDLSKAAAARAGVEMRLAEVRGPQDFESAIAAAVRDGAQGLVLQQIFYPQSSTIAGLALKFRLPAIGWQKPFAEAGGLIAFGPLPEDNYRRLARYVDRLLAGVPPADLPIEQATRTELIINQRAAKLLGVAIPPLLLARADEVIE